jgi:hypothetical protein
MPRKSGHFSFSYGARSRLGVLPVKLFLGKSPRKRIYPKTLRMGIDDQEQALV